MDTSALVALASDDDQFRNAALEYVAGTSGLELITNTIILGEFYSLIRYRRGYGPAVAATAAVRESVKVVHLDEPGESRVWEILAAYGGVPLSYEDASLVVLADQLGVESVFGFDSDLRLAGLHLVP